MKSNAKIEFGDFQTPLALAREICGLLRRQNLVPDFVLEPTCGMGAFLVSAAEAFPQASLRGWDINPEYVELSKTKLALAGAGPRASVRCQDFFAHDWDSELQQSPGRLLIVGNLP